jgi:hypothetical protein
MLFFHGRLSHAGVGDATRHSWLHSYIGDERVTGVLTPEFLGQSDLVATAGGTSAVVAYVGQCAGHRRQRCAELA